MTNQRITKVLKAIESMEEELRRLKKAVREAAANQAKKKKRPRGTTAEPVKNPITEGHLDREKYLRLCESIEGLKDITTP